MHAWVGAVPYRCRFPYNFGGKGKGVSLRVQVPIHVFVLIEQPQCVTCFGMNFWFLLCVSKVKVVEGETEV